MFSAVEDDLEVEFVPGVARENFFQVAFGLDDVFPTGQPPTFGETVDVGVDWKGRNAKCLSHDDGCGFMADTRQFLQFFETLRNNAVVMLDEHFAEFGNGGGFGWGESAGANDFADFIDRDMSHFLRCVGEFEEGGSDLIDADVGALCGE